MLGDPWDHYATYLIPKTFPTVAVSDFREIACVAVLRKVYLRRVPAQIEDHQPTGPNGVLGGGPGAVAGSQRAVVAQTIEKADAWAAPAFVGKVGVSRAFPSICNAIPQAALDGFGVPNELTAIAISENTAPKLASQTGF